MRWFKHFTDNHRGRSIQYLMDNLGHKGLTYFLLLEMCAEKLDKTKGEIVTETDCEFYFHTRVVASNLRLSVAGVSSLLRACAEVKLFSYEINSKEIKIFMPMLLELLEKNLKKRTPRSLQESQKVPSDIDKDIEKIKIKKQSTRKNKKENTPTEVVAPEYSTSNLIALYCDKWKEAYKSSMNPLITPKTAKDLKQFLEHFGKEKAEMVVSNYFKMPDQWFLTKKHDVYTMLNNTNSIIHFIETGRLVTKKDLQNIDKNITNNNLIKDIEENGI